MSAWTPEEDAIVVDFWERNLTASDIANSGKLPGRSRSAIIGRINRLRGAGNKSIAKRTKPSRPRAIGLRSEEIEKEADQRSLYILQRRDNEVASFSEIGAGLGLSKSTVSKEYNSIIRDLEESEAK